MISIILGFILSAILLTTSEEKKEFFKKIHERKTSIFLRIILNILKYAVGMILIILLINIIVKNYYNFQLPRFEFEATIFILAAIAMFVLCHFEKYIKAKNVDESPTYDEKVEQIQMKVMTRQKVVDLLLLMIAVTIGVLSYVFNMGWLRIIYSIPLFVYSFTVLILGIIYVFKNCNVGNIKQRKVFYISLLTYILFNVFLLDSGDTGSSYCFFGLIKLDFLVSLLSDIAMMSLVISLISIGLIIKAIKNKKNISKIK